jgi:uncharacterized membrane protein YgaE (UPF0421/DUF939 family)
VKRLASAAWPLLQTTVAATASWMIALRLAGNPEPFFAPIAAIVALNGPRGERGSQAMRLITGVILGIIVGELVVVTLGSGYGRIALATFVAMLTARLIGGARLVVIQAAAAAILTVAIANGEAGVNRLTDAFIGTAVAMLFSQVLFSPEPVRLLRAAEAEVLTGIARGLELTSNALSGNDESFAEGSLATLRAVGEQLVEVSRLRTASERVARHSMVWRSQLGHVMRERVTADRLELLAAACVMFARTGLELSVADREILAAPARELAQVLAALATAPGDRAVRNRAIDQTVHAARVDTADEGERDSRCVVARAMLRIVASDIMIFCGLTPDEARSALREGSLNASVSAPPPTPRIPFGLDRWSVGGNT